MGWSNFEGATFVRKIGRYLDFDIKDKTNSDLKEQTKGYEKSEIRICITGDIANTKINISNESFDILIL